MKSSKRAFSLVELAVVLVILGLLVGGILSGIALIHLAQLRSVVTEHSTILTAVNGFRDKYLALPGDFNGATAVWKWQLYGDSTCINRVSATAAEDGACDGNSNGIIDHSDGSSNSGYYETSQFWYHLSRAGLLSANVRGSAAGIADIPSQDYKSRYPSGFWSASSYAGPAGNNWGAPDFFEAVPPVGNIMAFGHYWGNSNMTSEPLMPNADAFWIDTKLDDGKPYSGSVIIPANWIVPNCGDGTTDYLLSNDGADCSLVFSGAF